VKRSEVLFGVLRVPLDALAALAAVLLSYRLREARIDLIPGIQLLEPAQTLPPFPDYLTAFAVPGVVLFLAIAALLGLYSLVSLRSAWREVWFVGIGSVLWLALVVGWFFLVRRELFYSRILLVHATIFLALFVLLVRSAVVVLQRALLRRGIGVRLVVSLGHQELPASARTVLEDDPRYRYLGHVHDLPALERLGDVAVDLVLQTDPDPSERDTLELIDACRSRHVGYAFLPPVLADVPHQLRVERLGLLPMVRLQPTPLDGWGRVFKRGFDFVGSVLLLVLLAPLLLVLAFLIALEDGLPVLYVSRRIGEHGRRKIAMLKFRSMVRGADDQKQSLAAKNDRRDGPLFKVRHDPRVTRIGRVLRRFDLDEFPQLLNVLLGQMSLVGPRPHLPEEVHRYSAFQRRVFAVKPGMTGLAQVSGRSSLSFEEEVALDLRYIEEWSPLLDLWILWRTIFTVLSRRGRE
jgi:exopolysaccharide biosynthesis polyprenyl glycosylphosphotransferase